MVIHLLFPLSAKKEGLMHRLKHIVHIINNISDWSGKLLFLLPWAITAIILYEITLRFIFGHPTIWAHETSLMIFGALAILAGAYALCHRTHVNMDLFYGRLSPRGKAILDLVSSPLFFIFCAVLLWKGAEFAWRSIEVWEVSITHWHPPIWPIKCIIPIGAFLILLQGVAKFVSDLLIAIPRKGVE